MNTKNRLPIKSEASAFAESNIALIKYWGKRDTRLNLPVTNSLSMSLPGKGTHTTVRVIDHDTDRIIANDKLLPNDSVFATRILTFLNLFRDPNTHLEIQTQNNIPTAAGLASSASGFAALTLALNDLYGWAHDKTTLSRLARLGSGSACRSIFSGFVEWEKGERSDGTDSIANPLNIDWPELNIACLLVSQQQKPIDSRTAMQRTVETSPAYQTWPEQVAADLSTLKTALQQKDFTTLGETAERNAIAMHHTMHQATPSIDYDLPETKTLKHRIQQARENGLPLYFTQDAGPNLKILYLKNAETAVSALFPNKL